MKWTTQNTTHQKNTSRALLTALLCLVFSMAFSQSSVAYLRTGIPDAPRHLPTNQKEDIIPFELVRGMIVMQAQIDQQPGHFILDTGAPLMVINEDPVTPSKLAASFKQKIIVGETVIKDFNWAGTEEKKLDALVLDISHLEQAFQRPLKGMIGFNVLKGYELFFDYEKQIVRRYAGRKNQLHQQSRPLHNIPFQKFAHLPVITLKIGNKKFRFGLDTGACTNMIDQSVLNALDETVVTPLADEEVQGLDQHVNRVQAVQLKSVEAKGLVVEDLKFLATDLSELQSDEGIVLDGLLGYSFLSRMKFSISYPKQRIYVWEEVKTENGE